MSNWWKFVLAVVAGILIVDLVVPDPGEPGRFALVPGAEGQVWQLDSGTGRLRLCVTEAIVQPATCGPWTEPAKTQRTPWG